MARRTSGDMDGFRAWLGEFGLSEGTLDVYIRDVTKAREVGIIDRLRDEDLAPKTKRHILAGCRHWAKYTKDEKLRESLERLRLPAARRKVAKVPLEREELFALLDELNKADYLPPPMLAAIGLMSMRGFRCGDVLRLRREELVNAKESGVLNFVAKGNRILEFKVLKTFRKYMNVLATYPGDWERVDDLIAPGGGAAGRRSAAAKAVERTLVKVGVRAGISGLYPHRLRRTYAVEYLRGMQGDPEALMKLTQHMQWATMTTAMEYVDHARGDELDAVAEKMFDR